MTEKREQAMSNPTVAYTEKLIEGLHQYQTDWRGKPYHFHPIAVMKMMRTISVFQSLSSEEQLEADLTALLHDTLEDVFLHCETGEVVPADHPMARHMIGDDLRAYGYSDCVVSNVEMLTRLSNGETYIGKILNIVASRKIIVMLVKLCDNKHNSLPERREGLSPEKLKTALSIYENRYKRSMALLEAGLGLTA
jgi:(p)ppGpp synthase/HD superfamily hydrolase